jgi:hypothetical protein
MKRKDNELLPEAERRVSTQKLAAIRNPGNLVALCRKKIILSEFSRKCK